jgi:hypothetical protein
MIDQNNKPGESSTFDSFGSDPLSSASPASTPSASYTGQPDDLHDLFGSTHERNSDEEDPLAALRNDPNYSALIKDLEYIASQARLLFEPSQEAPSDEVWNKIQSKLHDQPEENE